MALIMFNPLEEKQILSLNERLSQPVAITLYHTGHKTDARFSAYCDALSRMVPSIRIVVEQAAADELPSMLLADRLRYRALPAGNELPPFLEAIQAISGSDWNGSQTPAVNRLMENRLPASLQLYIAPACTFCPRVVLSLLPLPLAGNHLELTIVDATLFPEAAATDAIQSVPTLLLDRQFRWTGSIPLEEVVEVINTRDPTSLGAASLATIVKDGQAQDLAQMMLEAAIIFPAFYDLLTHREWSLRLGAMVVLETLAAENQTLAAEMLNPLWERFNAVSDQIKGDILYMFGEIGDRRASAWLQSVLSANFDAEIKEAAEEALEKIPCSTFDIRRPN